MTTLAGSKRKLGTKETKSKFARVDGVDVGQSKQAEVGHNPDAGADLKLDLSQDWGSDETLKNQFVAAFDELKNQFLHHTRTEFDNLPEEYVQRIDRLITYTTLNGKMNRGLFVVKTAYELCKVDGKEFTTTVARKAVVLGWCIEVLQAHFLVADDIMDQSITRRGEPCWYKNEDVQLDAVNDTIILESFLYFLLKHHFTEKDEYITFNDMYRTVALQTQMGQMLDLLSQPQGKKGPEILAKFDLDLYMRIITYKTAFYTFYVPLSSGMIVAGFDNPEQLKVCRKISIALGQKFQIQDDYLDCFADPKHLGKIGTDIKDHKCTWLVVQALQMATPEQRKLLETYYGKEDQKDQDVVKKLYVDLKLPELYEKQEEESYKNIVAVIEANKELVPTCVFYPLLNKIHKRTR